jgi:NADPH:quinone reductase-like Zn-dependent oxidoreductase
LIDGSAEKDLQMKGIVYYDYGSPSVLQYEEMETPTPGNDEVLIKVRAASVNPYDWHFMRGAPYPLRIAAGLSKPKDRRLGADVAGRVEAVGKNVTRFKPGDEVFGVGRGAFAEYACACESKVVLKTKNVTFEQAASVPIAGLTALQGLRRGGLGGKGQLQPGQKVLINGAAGGVGTFAVQIAKSFNAEVTGVCSTRNVDMVRSIGANRVIDYTQEDFTTSGQRYDLILDCVSNHSLSAFRRVLSPKGSYIIVGAADGGGRWMLSLLARLIKALGMSWLGSQKLVIVGAKIWKEDLTILCDLMAAGKVTPIIDRNYSLREVPEAIRYLEAGHARGKVVITV